MSDGSVGRLLRNHDARRIWFSRSFSRFGDTLESLALMFLVYELTGSAVAMGMVMLFSILPNLVLSPLAGVIADRVSPKAVMILGDGFRFAAILVIPILYLAGSLGLWHVYAVAFVASVAESFYEPAAGVMIVSVVAEEDLGSYNSVTYTSNSVARGLGYAASGVLVAFVGLAAPFFINSTSFLLSAVAAATLRYSRRPETESDAEKRLFGDLREGLRYVGRKGAVLAAMGVIVLINFVTAPISQFVPIIFSEILLASEAFAGLFMTLTVVGSIAGGVVSLGVERRGVSFAVVAAATLVTIGALILASVATRSVVAFSTLYFFAGLGGALIAVRAMTLIQRSVEPTFMGRVGSVVNMAFLAAAPLAAVVSGAVISARSMRFLLLVSSGLCVASAVGVLLTLRGLGEGNDLEPSGDVADT